MSQHGVVVEDRPQVARVGDRVDTLVQRGWDSVEQGRSLDAHEQSLGTRRVFLFVVHLIKEFMNVVMDVKLYRLVLVPAECLGPAGASPAWTGSPA